MYWCCWTGCNTCAQSNEVKQFNTNANSWCGTERGRHLIWNTYSTHTVDDGLPGQLQDQHTGQQSWESAMLKHLSYTCIKRKTMIMFVYLFLELLARCYTRMAKEFNVVEIPQTRNWLTHYHSQVKSWGSRWNKMRENFPEYHIAGRKQNKVECLKSE